MRTKKKEHIKTKEIRIKLSEEAYKKVEKVAEMHDSVPATYSAILLMEGINRMYAQLTNESSAQSAAKLVEVFSEMVGVTMIEQIEQTEEKVAMNG